MLGSTLPERVKYSKSLLDFGDESLVYPPIAEDYQLLDKVGFGATAEVFRARCIPNNSQVAVKQVNLDNVTTGLDLIIQEAKVMRELQHPNVLRLHAAFVSDSALWMVMPYISGGPLSSILKKRFPNGMDEATLATIARDVLRGLEYLHSHGCMHRDLKASNMLMHHNGHVLLADFGVTALLERETPFSLLAPVTEEAEVVAQEGTGSGSPMSSLEGSENSIKDGSLSSARPSCGNIASYLARKTVCGTLHFMAPEVMEEPEEGYDQSADIWSFGMMMIELATGKLPLNEKTSIRKLAYAIMHDEPPSLDDGVEHAYSDAAKDFVKRCLTRDPAQRPSAGELLQHRFIRQARSPEFLACRLLTIPDPVPGDPESPIAPASPLPSEAAVRGSQSTVGGSGRWSSELPSTLQLSSRSLAPGRKKRKCNALEWRFEFRGAAYWLLAQILHNHSSAAVYLNRRQVLYRKYGFWEQMTWQGDEFVIRVPEVFGPLSGHQLTIRLTSVTVLEGAAFVDDTPLHSAKASTRHMTEPLPLRDSQEVLQVLSGTGADSLSSSSLSASNSGSGEACPSPLTTSANKSTATPFETSKSSPQQQLLAGSPKPPKSPYELLASESWSWETEGHMRKPVSQGPRCLGDCSPVDGVQAPATSAQDGPGPRDQRVRWEDQRTAAAQDPEGGSAALDGKLRGPDGCLGPFPSTDRDAQQALTAKAVMRKPPAVPKGRVKGSGGLSGYLAMWGSSRRNSVDGGKGSSPVEPLRSRRVSWDPLASQTSDLPNAPTSPQVVERSVFSAPDLGI